jgi:hypothetical protein
VRGAAVLMRCSNEECNFTYRQRVLEVSSLSLAVFMPS